MVASFRGLVMSRSRRRGGSRASLPRPPRRGRAWPGRRCRRLPTGIRGRGPRPRSFAVRARASGRRRGPARTLPTAGWLRRSLERLAASVPTRSPGAVNERRRPVNDRQTCAADPRRAGRRPVGSASRPGDASDGIPHSGAAGGPQREWSGPRSVGQSSARCWCCCCSIAARRSRPTAWSTSCGASARRPPRSRRCRPTSRSCARRWATGSLVTRGHAYVLRAGRRLGRRRALRALVADGRELLGAGEPGPAAERLRAALALWRGPALADVAYEAFAQREIARLEELRISATRGPDRGRARGRAGRGAGPRARGAGRASTRCASGCAAS